MPGRVGNVEGRGGSVGVAPGFGSGGNAPGEEAEVEAFVCARWSCSFID